VVAFRVLGPPEALGPSGPVRLGGGKQRLLLAVLVLHAGEVVSRGALIDALWPVTPPASAPQSLESYVSRLRAALRAAGARAISSTTSCSALSAAALGRHSPQAMPMERATWLGRH
jgi:DNA-binding SARP family transcriptional activator